MCLDCMCFCAFRCVCVCVCKAEVRGWREDDMRVPGLLTPLTTHALTDRPLSRHGGCSGKALWLCVLSVSVCPCATQTRPLLAVMKSHHHQQCESCPRAPHNHFFMDSAAADQGRCCHVVTCTRAETGCNVTLISDQKHVKGFVCNVLRRTRAQAKRAAGLWQLGWCCDELWGFSLRDVVRLVFLWKRETLTSRDWTDSRDEQVQECKHCF